MCSQRLGAMLYLTYSIPHLQSKYKCFHKKSYFFEKNKSETLCVPLFILRTITFRLILRRNQPRQRVHLQKGRQYGRILHHRQL